MVGALWRRVRATDFESRGPGFDPDWRHRVVTNFPEYWLKARKRLLRPDMAKNRSVAR